jgi:hypothetical protein
MTKKPVQLLLPFEEVTPEEISPAVPERAVGPGQADEEVLFAFEQLQRWLVHPRTGKPITETGGEALRAVENALVYGRNSYFHAAEDMLNVLALRNGRIGGDDIQPGIAAGRPDFQEIVEELRGLLDDHFAAKGDGPTLG